MLYSFPPMVEWEQGMFTSPSALSRDLGCVVLTLCKIPKQGRELYNCLQTLKADFQDQDTMSLELSSLTPIRYFNFLSFPSYRKSRISLELSRLTAQEAGLHCFLPFSLRLNEYKKIFIAGKTLLWSLRLMGWILSPSHSSVEVLTLSTSENDLIWR